MCEDSKIPTSSTGEIDRLRQRVEELERFESRRQQEEALNDSDEPHRHLVKNANETHWNDGKPDGAHGTVPDLTALDITALRQAEEALMESEGRLSLIYNSTMDLLCLMKVEPGEIYRISSMNKRVIETARFYNYDVSEQDLIGRQADVVMEQTLKFGKEVTRFALARFREAIRAGMPIHYEEAPLQTPKGTYYSETTLTPVVGRDGNCTYLLYSSRDITERKRAENLLKDTEVQLRQLQKMESIGRLAGGVAHDFNNMLTAINGYADLLLLELPAADPLRMNAEEIKKAGNRAADLVRQLLAFSRKQILQPKVLNLNLVVSDNLKILRRLIGEDVELATDLASDLLNVKADPAQTDQVILNLVLNARDAMPEGGTLTLQTANVVLDEQFALRHVSVAPGPYVLLAITDTGTGMDEMTLSRIFEPFFTTKDEERGTGLGLSTVYGIVKQSGGYIWAQSEVGKGTTFKIYFPPVEELADQPETDIFTAAEERQMTVLIVEDDEIVRTLACQILRMNGFQVLEASNGRQGMDVAEGHPHVIDLLLTDVIMPQMNGKDLADRLMRSRPGLKVLYMSGYTSDPFVGREILEPEAYFLSKPFTPNALMQRVRKMLGLK